MEASIAIPARLNSSRFPEKLLANLGGKSVLQHVIERAQKVKQAQNVFVLTDSELIAKKARAFDVRVIMTSPDCQSGTERIASVIGQIPGDLILNLQGDEPFIEPRMLDELIESWHYKNCDLITPVLAINSTEQIFDPNVVKVAIDNAGRALYFSRSPIPYLRGEEKQNWISKAKFWEHIGVYGYARESLEKYSSLMPTDLEKAECLEQLRFLANGLTINTLKTSYKSISIDTKEDLEKAKKHLLTLA